jgi:ribosome-binding factor A
MHQDSRGRRGHKDLQVCRQVFDALTYALAEVDDPLIDELSIAAVTPAPSAARVEVTLVPSRYDFDVDEALARLAEIVDDLREEVAAEITRRRVPELAFRITHLDPRSDLRDR